jgi:hypothetical protein
LYEKDIWMYAFRLCPDGDDSVGMQHFKAECAEGFVECEDGQFGNEKISGTMDDREGQGASLGIHPRTGGKVHA